LGKSIAIANQKGGVGKTTTAVNLAAGLQHRGKKTLLCDFDPQGNATTGLGLDPVGAGLSIYDVLIRGASVEKAVNHTPWCDLIPCNMNLAAAEVELVELDRREYRLKDALAPLRERYDFLLIDCPPSLGLLTINALNAADTVLVPMQCEYYALEGLSQLISSIRALRRGQNPDLDVEGILLTMYDGRTNLTMQVADELKRHFGDKVFTTPIPRSVRLSEAPSHGRPILAYDRWNKGSEAYLRAAEELISRNEPGKTGGDKGK